MSNLTSEVVLKPCPFCSGIARFCADHDHACHYILCTGCGLTADMAKGLSDDIELVSDLQRACADKWNLRV